MLRHPEPKTDQIVRSQSEQRVRTAFASDRELPRSLEALNELSKNFYWSWNDHCINVFRDLDPRLWDECEQNPRLMLQRIDDLRLWQCASDIGFTERVETAVKEFNDYLTDEPKKIGKISGDNPIAYFCAEYGIHNSLPIYSGGLGILAGDHLKSASDLNLPLVGIGLFYRYGYFRQKIAHDGWQEERYVDSFESEVALETVKDDDGDELRVSLIIRGREVFAKAWKAQIGNITLYLLDSNVEENESDDRYITGHLYGGDSETRIVQEQLLGIGGVRLLRALGIDPSVFHLNEGHSAFLSLELARERIKKEPSLSFVDVISMVRKKCVFTTHTPVDAGNDSFDPELLEECFNKEFVAELGVEFNELLELGRTDPDDKFEWFGMTPLALRMSRVSNGVSAKHGEVSRGLWKKMYPAETEMEDVPITSITNGVHPSTWIDPLLKKIFEEEIGDDWASRINNPDDWKRLVEALPDKKIWQAHSVSKHMLVALVRKRTLKKYTGKKTTIHEHKETARLLDPDVLTIGFARRIAAYKRWNLIMHDIDRMLGMIDDSRRPVQFVFAGKAHPQDRNAKAILQDLMTINSGSSWQERAVFLDDYDQEIARYLVRGVDVWMNVPRRPLEASGTSGQKAAMNGVLNFSVLDGWWLEGFNGKNGFAIGPREDPEDLSKDELDALDAESLYSTLENEIIPTFYDVDNAGLPLKWIEQMKNSIATLTPEFSSDRMVSDYLENIYSK